MIQVFITGGTLDKDYDPITGELIFADSPVTAMLDQANITLEINVKTLFQKDSLNMVDADREYILQACKNSLSNQIVITHGTDTMPETAQYLNHSLTNKTIILTGAMRPFNLGNSDALFNLGSALMAVKNTKNGVFIAMNGQLLEASRVVKNKKSGVFENIGDV